MAQIRSEDLLEFVAGKGTLRLTTGKQRKMFTVRLVGNDLEIIPDSTRKSRTHTREALQRICNRFAETRSFQPKNYRKLTVNASYALAILQVYLAELTDLPSTESYEKRLTDEVHKALTDDSSVRQRRLQHARTMPEIRLAVTKVYLRNPDVIAEILSRADGKCEECRTSAPFKRKSDGTPYLEVHHRRPLAKGGEDTVENALALCPKCHRKAHHG